MNLNNWLVFDKSGSPINWVPDSYLNLNFESQTGKNASGFLITDSNGDITSSVISNSGYGYDSSTLINYIYEFDESKTPIDITNDSSLGLNDITIYNPNETIVHGIESVTPNINTSGFIYPSVIYTGALFLKPISKGLVESETLFILQQTGSLITRPYESNNSTLLFEMDGEENEISLFTVDETSQTISWSDNLEFTINQQIENIPIAVNIGFLSEDEGVFERKLNMYNVINGVKYLMAQFIINAEAIGEDERFRTLLSNFGAPDPIKIEKIFKESNINEDALDYELINYKSKQMMLDYSEIISYIGTYKSLINAIKWLGYDDIFIREWFLNAKTNSKLSLLVPFDATKRRKTILSFSSDERKNLKKINKLSLTYCITKETKEVDKWGTPITKNCYNYSIDEIFIKLVSLKNWLEKNIIGVNAKIIDITGEGIYYEVYKNIIYSTDNKGINYKVNKNITPISVSKNQELINGSSDIKLSLLELNNTHIYDLDYSFEDFVDYVWDPNNPNNNLTVKDPSYLANPDNYLTMGAPLNFPLYGIKDIQWKGSIEKSKSGVLTNEFVSSPLWIYDNEIRFYNIFDTSSTFYDSSTNLNIILEKAYLRDPSIDVWENSINYSIYPDPSLGGGYIMESSLGVITKFDNYVNLLPGNNSLLNYKIDSIYKVPLLSMQNFNSLDASGNIVLFETDKLYHLDILDGKIYTGTNLDPITRHYINFNYDTSLNEQMITLNLEYFSPRMPLYLIDPSIYYWANPSGLNGSNSNSLIVDNSIYSLNVNHIGDYKIELYGWDDFNIMHTNKLNSDATVWIKHPTIYSIVDSSCNIVCSDASISQNNINNIIDNNNKPLYDSDVHLEGLLVEQDSSDNTYIKIPSITYFQPVPSTKSISRFYNLTELVLNVSNNSLTINNKYETFKLNDSINILLYNKDNHNVSHIIDASITNIAGDIVNIDTSVSFNIDASNDIYILNDTFRNAHNPINHYDSSTFSLEIEDYIFNINQMVGVIIKDNISGYTFGSSYRVINVDGSIHTFDNLFPQFVIDNSSRYNIKVKHAFSTYTSDILFIKSASESSNNLNIYVGDDYTKYFLDNTFIMNNILFDQDYVNNQWYDISDNLINSDFYKFNNHIQTDVSSLVIFSSEYDTSDYLLNQKNIWTVKNTKSKDILMKVFNSNLPFIFDASGYFDIQVESYDKFGNLSSTKQEGLIKIF